jgi:hypothetical protein
MNEQTTIILVDTALASGSANALDPEERKLQELVLAIRDDARKPAVDFELRMNARVAAGFPRRRSGIRGRLAALLATRPRMVALGTAASILIGLVVALSVTSSDRRSLRPTSAAGESAAQAGTTAVEPAAPQKTVAPASGAGSTSSDAVVGPTPVPPPPAGFAGGSNRKVERSAALVLAPSMDELSHVGDQVIAVTDRYRGFVLHSSVTSAADQGSSGSFDLRIPVRNLQAALRDLSALADVKSRTENADDVTASFVSAQTRLQELNAERRGLLRRLERVETDRAAAALRARIRIVNRQIEAQNQVLRDMRRRTNYASVSVTLEPKQDGSGGGIGDGARDLRDSLVDAANLSLRVLGVALPIALLLALIWGIGGRVNRRRREAVLDQR